MQVVYRASVFVFSCDFEENMCGLKQDDTDSQHPSQTGTQDWLRQSGNTPSSNTGPASGHQSKYYIYYEASYAQNRDFARYEYTSHFDT